MSTAPLFLFDDAVARTFEPFALTRPICELRVGALLLRQRWERALQRDAGGVVTAEHLRDFDEPWGVKIASGKIPKGSIVANSRFAVGLSRLGSADVWRNSGQVAAIVLDRDVEADEVRAASSLESLRSGGTVGEAPGRWMHHVWDPIGHLDTMLTEDITTLVGDGRADFSYIPAQQHPVVTEPGAEVEPNVFFDTKVGPVYVARGAVVQAFTRVIGPCYIGAESQVGGDKVSGCSIGEVCKVHGEVSATIFLGHSNKGHDGFVGHSYLGRWVNLGAGTTTSNLKNTYGTVQLWTPGGQTDSGLQFLGTLFGDHVKTGIGMMLTTGTVIGAGANIYGSGMPPKAVPPFSWGEAPRYDAYKLDKFLEVAERMMERRHVRLSDNARQQFREAYARRWTAT